MLVLEGHLIILIFLINRKQADGIEKEQRMLVLVGQGFFNK